MQARVPVITKARAFFMLSEAQPGSADIIAAGWYNSSVTDPVQFTCLTDVQIICKDLIVPDDSTVCRTYQVSQLLRVLIFCGNEYELMNG